MESFGARVHRAVGALGPLCVGIDPHPSLLSAWGLTDDLAGLEQFSEIVVEALADRVAVMKPQSAFYERFGSRGVAVLESTIRQLRRAGTVVVLDVKRGDIGSTAAAYAAAYLSQGSPFEADAITASPYLGVGALRPMIDLAAANGRGLFVLARTSNPEGVALQQARLADGRTVAQSIVDEISQVNAGRAPIGDLGIVYGATAGEAIIDVSKVNGPILIPGLGAQGGRPEDLPELLGGGRQLVLASYSRQVLSGGPSVSGLRDAADHAAEACARVLTIP
jgi:orotidine-5'-phosphate decarboxylase